MDPCLKILQIQAICITRRLCWIPGRKVFLQNVVKFFFSRLKNFCFAVYFYLFVKFSSLFLRAVFTRTRDVYPHPLPATFRHTPKPCRAVIANQIWECCYSYDYSYYGSKITVKYIFNKTLASSYWRSTIIRTHPNAALAWLKKKAMLINELVGLSAWFL